MNDGPRVHGPAAHAAAATAAILGGALAIRLSAPALVRPLGAALLLLAVLPGVATFTGAWLIGRFGRHARRVAGVIAALAAAAPSLLIAATPMGRWRLAAILGGAVVVSAALLLPRWRGAALLLPWAAILTLLAWPADRKVTLDGADPLLIVGFDGATWDVIDPMIAAGELPNFRRLKEQGACGVLESDMPSASPRVWTTIATGVSPEVHGVGGFTAGRAGLKVGRIWDEVVHTGGRAGVVGWLVNWPPDPDLAYSVPGWLARGYRSLPDEATPVAAVAQSLHHLLELPSPAVWPWLASLAVSRADHAVSMICTKLHFLLFDPPQEEQTWQLRRMRAQLMTDLSVELMRREHPQFAALVTYPTDSLGHLYWQYHEAEAFPEVDPPARARYADVVSEAYRVADRTLGRLLDLVDLETTTVMVVSDHGMAALPPERRRFRVRETQLLAMLEEGEHLQAFSVGRAMVIGPRDDDAAGILAVHNAFDQLRAARNLDRGAEAFELDWHPRQQDMILLRLKPEGVEPDDRIRIDDQECPVRRLCVRESRSGEHTLRGTIAVIGPGVRPGHAFEARLVDVAPTALHAMSLPVPVELEGAALTGLWRPDHPRSAPPERRPGRMRTLAAPGEEGAGTTDERLRELGYVE